MQFRRFLHNSPPSRVLVQKSLPTKSAPIRPALIKHKKEAVKEDTVAPVHRAKRNQLGVQLLSRELHEQVFRGITPTPTPLPFVQIAKDHLKTHGLDITQGSVLPNISFTLPPLQGNDLDQHFHVIGTETSEPWLSLAKDFVGVGIPPKPDFWHIHSGWTKYYYLPDGSSYHEHVDFPIHDGGPETMLSFDVETMPKLHPYAVMACAASKNAWYAWISPWLLGESSDPHHLIPVGDPSAERVIVGHNVSYDRSRILEEYSLQGSRNRFLDTMALHVAVQGISAHQRPAWMNYRKKKQKAAQRREEAVEAVYEIMKDVNIQQATEEDQDKREDLRRMKQEMEESLPQLQTVDLDADVSEVEMSSKRWEDLTSANSLADVAKLHLDISVEKEIRNDFMSNEPSDILNNIQEYLTYCANDVSTTHAVYAKVLPGFLRACPSPVSFAGVLTMGSSFLPVDSSWQKYLENAERTYRELEKGVKRRLVELAEEVRGWMEDERWKEDVWLSQLDWTPKVAGPSRGVMRTEQIPPTSKENIASTPQSVTTGHPRWYTDLLTNGSLCKSSLERIAPLLLQLSFDGHPLRYTPTERWHYLDSGGNLTRLPSNGGSKTTSVLGKTHGLPYLKNGRMSSFDVQLAKAISSGERSDDVERQLLVLADFALRSESSPEVNPWLSQLDWSRENSPSAPKRVRAPKSKAFRPLPVRWPKWYWDLAKPRKGAPPGSLDITVRNRVSPILLRLSWLGWPLFHSREHGWIFRVPSTASFTTRLKPLQFVESVDTHLQESYLHGGFQFYKLPHKDGEKANVGSPLGKTFIKYAADGTLCSPGDEAKEALDMNAQCSYWISARDRILNQMVVWEQGNQELGFPHKGDDTNNKWGVILPQVITMGTVTRRAIERTWLTASNAKKNRIGSELKAMVRAPPGYAIVGADVDSEELWISSCMGDAQFGMHGATAIGWMTLEGTKAAGTDLHSKTANILGITRDQAKVFNYSRIYGAGMRHAVLLLLQANAGMLPEEAQRLAESLYASTKGKNTHRGDIFGRKFWFGGTESFVFNKLEEIALSDQPQTPALGCGVTHALSKEYLPAEFGADYMPSRINWVVQSSGVDYLHMLIVSMEHLITKYDINARYLISVHDELRYLVEEKDRYRAALALQIANLWTRSLFAVKLGMDDLPQGVAFFSTVDVDKVLRKEVDMSCVTPSQPTPIPPGESLDIAQVLAKTNNGSLWADGRSMSTQSRQLRSLEAYRKPNYLAHRASSTSFLRAQATVEFNEILHLASRISGIQFSGGPEVRGKQKRIGKQSPAPVGNGENYDWSAFAEREMHSLRLKSL